MDAPIILSAEQRAVLAGVFSDAFAYRNQDDDSFPVDLELKEKYAALAQQLGLDVDTGD